MNIAGIIVLALGAVMLLVALSSLYATTMTVRTSTLSPWSVVLGVAGLVTVIVGVAVLL